MDFPFCVFHSKTVVYESDFYPFIFFYFQHNIVWFEVVEGEPCIVDDLKASQKLNENLEFLAFEQNLLLHEVLKRY